jgi:hypothetical protein
MFTCVRDITNVTICLNNLCLIIQYVNINFFSSDSALTLSPLPFGLFPQLLLC